MQEKLSGQLAFYNVLVYGWYNKNNIGDDLFCDAFKKLFTNINFTFSDNLTENNVKDASAIFIGGGSFLFSAPNILDECLNIIKTKPIFYIGVGAETEIHPIHKDLITLAKLVAIRSSIGFEKIKNLNSNTIVIPDIVYSLYKKCDKIVKPQSVLILPNISVVPKNIDEHWKYNSWENFKFEFSQFLDYLIENKFDINFLSMCNNNQQNDNWAAYEIINSMSNRDDYIIKNSKNIIDLFSEYEYVITQRFHGIILSELTNKPYISICHHDKLKTSYFNSGSFISYYGSSKQMFIDEFNFMKDQKIEHSIAIESDIFEELKIKVNSILFER